MIEHKGNIRGEDVPLPTWGTVAAEHEIAAGVTIACVGTDLCRYCQAAPPARSSGRGRKSPGRTGRGG